MLGAMACSTTGSTSSTVRSWRNTSLQNNVQFVVISQSAVRPDETWNHVVHMPKSFAMKVASMYPIAYQTTARDITVYRVLNPSAIGPLLPLDWTAPDRLRPSNGRPGRRHPYQALSVSRNGRRFYVGRQEPDVLHRRASYQRGLPGRSHLHVGVEHVRPCPNGTHTVWIKAVDGSGNFSAEYVTVNVEN